MPQTKWYYDILSTPAVKEVSEDMVQSINVGTSRNAKKKATKTDLENMQQTINTDFKKKITDVHQKLDENQASLKEYFAKQIGEYIKETEEARLREQHQTRFQLKEMADQSEQNMQKAEQKMQKDLSSIQTVILDLGKREIQNQELQRINGEEQNSQRRKDREQRQHMEQMMEKLMQSQTRTEERFYSMMDRMMPTHNIDVSRVTAVDVNAPVTPEFNLFQS